MAIPFNRPYVTGNENKYIAEVLESRRFSGNGPFTRKCEAILKEMTGAKKVVLCPSGTAALEMMMILADIGPGDEVIMPSFTFSSTANAVALREALPVFVDIRPDTLNIDEALIEKTVTPRTKAVVPVHYAGVGCEMDAIRSVAERHGLLVLEDAAQGICAAYKDKALGSIGQMGALSFHETKNIHCGEGGALLINDERYIERAEIVCEKGTDRSRFFRGEVDKYTWVDLGSSFLLNEISAAFLYAQLENAKAITERRLDLWNGYYRLCEKFECEHFLRRPLIPSSVSHNGHIYYVLFNDGRARDKIMKRLKENGIMSVFHYIPLDSSPFGSRSSHRTAELEVSRRASDTLLRLPLFYELDTAEQERICGLLEEALTRNA